MLIFSSRNYMLMRLHPDLAYTRPPNSVLHPPRWFRLLLLLDLELNKQGLCSVGYVVCHRGHQLNQML